MSTVIVSKEDYERQKKYVAKLIPLMEDRMVFLGRPLTYFIRTYGCQLNEADSEKIAGILESIGMIRWNEEDEDTRPDFLFLNTCTIRENAEDRLYGNLGAYKKWREGNKALFIGVCGCMMKQSHNVDKIKKSFPFVDCVFGPADIHRVPEYIYHRLIRHRKLYQVSEEDYLPEDLEIPISHERKFRALIPIMYGCNNYCTYCIVPYTRGRERSRSSEAILQQLHQIAELGYKEILLLGQNVNSYGKDRPGEMTFAQLLAASAEITSFSRIRFMTSHPKDISEEVLLTMQKYPNIERHLHLPMQSGSSRILKEMNRHYDQEQYLKTALRFRELIPEGTISTDIIVGFPGETEEDFEETLRVMRIVKFDNAFTFQYSIRPGTKAAAYENQIPPYVVKERFGRLTELQNALCADSNNSVLGTVEEILIEGQSATAKHVLTGRTNSNRLVNFTIPDGTVYKGQTLHPNDASFNANALEGELCEVRFTEARPFSIEGELVRLIDD